MLQPASPFNLLSTATNLFITEPNVPAVAVLTNNSSGVYQLTQQLPVPASPINVAGNANAARVYSITQDNGSNRSLLEIARTPAQVTTPGQVQSIEISTVTISRTLPVGICPVYGIASTDNNRIFILNRGSGTVTVINSQFNELDTTPNRQNLDSATGTLCCRRPPGSRRRVQCRPGVCRLLCPCVAAGDGQLRLQHHHHHQRQPRSIRERFSAVWPGGDGSGGNGPATLTILRDGSRVYVANQKDSTVSVVSLTNYQVLATIPGDRPSRFRLPPPSALLMARSMSFLRTSPT